MSSKLWEASNRYCLVLRARQNSTPDALPNNPRHRDYKAEQVDASNLFFKRPLPSRFRPRRLRRSDETLHNGIPFGNTGTSAFFLQGPAWRRFQTNHGTLLQQPSRQSWCERICDCSEGKPATI